jgi:hypothetical protein
MSQDTLLQNLWRVVNTWSLWLLPNEIPASVRISGVITLIVGVGVGLTVAHWQSEAEDSWRDELNAVWSKESQVAGIFVLTYVLFLVGVTTQVAVDAIEGRLLLPVYVPLIVIGLESLFALASKWNDGVGPVSGTQVLTILVGVWLLYPGALSTKRFLIFSQMGTGAASDTVWNEARVLEWLKAPPEGPIYSNFPSVLYFRRGIVAQRVRQTYWRSPTRTQDPEQFSDAVASSTGAVVVWLKDAETLENLLALDSLLARGTVDTLLSSPHGSVYRVSHSAESAALESRRPRSSSARGLLWLGRRSIKNGFSSSGSVEEESSSG